MKKSISICGLLFNLVLLFSCITITSYVPQKLPEFWPPPEPSAFSTIPRDYLTSMELNPTLGQISHKLELALEERGYFQRSWLSVPNGFALMTRMERIRDDGTSYTKKRWATKNWPPDDYSLSEFLGSLFRAKAGYYRIIVFLISNENPKEHGPPLSEEKAAEWLQTGAKMLPSYLAILPYTLDHYCSAYIYEYQKPKGHNPFLKRPSNLEGRTHLEKAGIWSEILKIRSE